MEATTTKAKAVRKRIAARVDGGYACRTPFDCTLPRRVRHTAEGGNSSLPRCGLGVGFFKNGWSRTRAGECPSGVPLWAHLYFKTAIHLLFGNSTREDSLDVAVTQYNEKVMLTL